MMIDLRLFVGRVEFFWEGYHISKIYLNILLNILEYLKIINLIIK